MEHGGCSAELVWIGVGADLVSSDTTYHARNTALLRSNITASDRYGHGPFPFVESASPNFAVVLFLAGSRSLATEL